MKMSNKTYNENLMRCRKLDAVRHNLIKIKLLNSR